MKYKTKQDKQTKTKGLRKGLIERTMSMLDEAASKTVHTEIDGWGRWCNSLNE